MTTFPLFAVGAAFERLGHVVATRPARGLPLEGALRRAVELLDPLLLLLLMAGYVVEEIDLTTRGQSRQEVDSVDTRSWSLLPGSPRGWDPPAGRAAVALWVAPYFPWSASDALGLTFAVTRLPAVTGVKYAFDCDRPGWLVIDLGDTQDPSKTLDPLLAIVRALREPLIAALMQWQSEAKPDSAVPCGLMIIYEPEVWRPVAAPWAAVAVLESGGTLADLAALVLDLREANGREALLRGETTDGSPEVTPSLGQRWLDAHHDDAGGFFGDLKEAIEAQVATFQAEGIGAPTMLNGLVNELRALPLTMALFLLYELSIIDPFAAQRAIAETLRTTPEDEERRYDWFRSLILVHVPPLVVTEAFKDNFPAGFDKGKMLCAAPPIEFDEVEGAVNIVGIRSMTDWRPVVPHDNTYDDWICVVWRENGRKRCLGWKATLDPGHYKSSDNVSHVENGQWRYKLGTHTGRSKTAYPAVQPFLVWWWYRLPGKARNRKGTTKDMGDGTVSKVNIHAGGNGESVGNTSDGCQVFHLDRGAEPWTTFIAIVQKATNQDDIPYTLIESSMLPDTSPLLPGGK